MSEGQNKSQAPRDWASDLARRLVDSDTPGVAIRNLYDNNERATEHLLHTLHDLEWDDLPVAKTLQAYHERSSGLKQFAGLAADLGDSLAELRKAFGEGTR